MLQIDRKITYLPGTGSGRYLLPERGYLSSTSVQAAPSWKEGVKNSPDRWQVKAYQRQMHHANDRMTMLGRRIKLTLKDTNRERWTTIRTLKNLACLVGFSCFTTRKRCCWFDDKEHEVPGGFPNLPSLANNIVVSTCDIGGHVECTVLTTSLNPFGTQDKRKSTTVALSAGGKYRHQPTLFSDRTRDPPLCLHSRLHFFFPAYSESGYGRGGECFESLL